MHPEAKGKGAEPQKNLAWTWVSAQEVGDASDCLLQRVPLASIRLFQPGGSTALRSECCFRAIHGSSCKYTYAKPTSSVSSSDFHLSCAKAIIQVAKPDLRDPLQIPIDIKKLMCSWEATENMSAVFHRFCREMVPAMRSWNFGREFWTTGVPLEKTDTFAKSRILQICQTLA